MGTERFAILWRSNPASDIIETLKWQHSDEIRTYTRASLDPRIPHDVEVSTYEEAVRELKPADSRLVLVPVWLAQEILPTTVFAEV